MQVLLLEAYEQLEADVGKEVDRALARQNEELSKLHKRVHFLEGHLSTERQQVAAFTDSTAKLESQLADVSARNAQYESGVYGLPQVCSLQPAHAFIWRQTPVHHQPVNVVQPEMLRVKDRI
jgi:centrosomal protein CEP290